MKSYMSAIATDVVDELKSTYDRIAEGFACERAGDTWGYEVLDEVLSATPPRGEILDIGCGPGRECAYMHSKGYNVTGADISEGMLKQARLLAPQVPFVVMDITRLMFKKKRFNAVIARSVILHVLKKDVLRALCEISRVLVPGGRVYIAIKKGVGERFVSEAYYGHTYRRFFSFFLEDEFSKLCQNAGFIVEKVYVTSGVNKEQMQYIIKKPDG